MICTGSTILRAECARVEIIGENILIQVWTPESSLHFVVLLAFSDLDLVWRRKRCSASTELANVLGHQV